MKTKMMFGLLTALVAVAVVSTMALPTLASMADEGNAIDPIVPDATPDQDQVQDETQTRQRLRLCDSTGVCSEDCTQTRSRIQAMDGSCGVGDGTCTGEGMQHRGGNASGQASTGADTQSRGRARDQSCLVTPTG